MPIPETERMPNSSSMVLLGGKRKEKRREEKRREGYLVTFASFIKTPVNSSTDAIITNK